MGAGKKGGANVSSGEGYGVGSRCRWGCICDLGRRPTDSDILEVWANKWLFSDAPTLAFRRAAKLGR